MLEILKKLHHLSAYEWSILIQSWAGLLVADLSLRLAGFQRTQAMFRIQPPVWKEASVVPRDEMEKIANLVSTSARHHLYPMHCLRRALVLQRLLRSRGVDAELRIGVRKQNGNLLAHAWVEVDKSPIGEPDQVEARFVPFADVLK